MLEWETLNEADWLDQITEHWMDTGSAALRSRGQFSVAMDASAETLQACKHLAGIDWPWSTTRIIPVRENWVPPGHAHHCGTLIYKAFYPCKAKVIHWETEHMDHTQSCERFARTLRKEDGDLPKFDLTLTALAGENSLGEIEGTIPEFTLTSPFTVNNSRLPCLALTPWILKASRRVVGISEGLNPPRIDQFGEQSPLQGLLETVKHTTLLHTR